MRPVQLQKCSGLATPDRFEPMAEVQAVGSGARAFPALADGLFFARSKNRLVCLDLAKGK